VCATHTRADIDTCVAAFIAAFVSARDQPGD